MIMIKEGFFDRIKRALLLFFLKNKAMSPLEMARYAFCNTTFYKNLYNSFPMDFKSLPLVKKEMIKGSSPYDLLSNALKDKVIFYGETTGSMGSPTPSFYTKKEFSGAYLL